MVKKYAPKNRKPRSNNNRMPRPSVSQNSKKINSLESKVNGHVQRNYHICRFPGTPGSFQLSPSTPLCFAANDFTRDSQSGGKLYFPIYTGAAPNITPSAAIAGVWEAYSPGTDFGLLPQYHQWADNNDDTTAKSAYQPLYAEYKLNFSRKSQAITQPDTYIRIDVVRAKRVYLTSQFHRYNLPDCLGALQNMAVSSVSSLQKRNAYNPDLFSVKTRWIKLPAVYNATSAVSRTHVMKMGFDKKLIKLDLDTSGSLTEEFFLGVDPRTPVWVIVSISEGSLDPDTTPLETTLTRKVVWRDQFGVSM